MADSSLAVAMGRMVDSIPVVRDRMVDSIPVVRDRMVAGSSPDPAEAVRLAARRPSGRIATAAVAEGQMAGNSLAAQAEGGLMRNIRSWGR